MKTLDLLNISILAIIVCTTASCKRDFNYHCGNLDDYFTHEIIQTWNEHITGRIDLDSIVLSGFNSSYNGFLRVHSQRIHFVDERFGKVFIFNPEGELQEERLGHGGGPKEIATGPITDYMHIPPYNHFLFGTSWDGFIYDSTWRIQNKFVLDWQSTHSHKEMVENPLPHMRNLYGIDYPIQRARYHNNSIYYQISSQHKSFSWVNSRDYYECARILCRVDASTGMVEDIFGRLSPVFRNYNFIGVFASLHFDISKDGYFYITFEPDSLIYVYTNDFKPIKAFGAQGTNMNTKYREMSTTEQIKRLWKAEVEEKGYYHSIELFEDLNLLFRGYTKGNHSEYDGLQVYRGDTLVADFDVPKNFSVMGYIEPYFYSCAYADDIVESVLVYRFKL